MNLRETLGRLLCKLNLHAYKEEQLLYSILRQCQRTSCMKKQYMNFHPAARRTWEDLTAEHEQRLRKHSTVIRNCTKTRIISKPVK